MTSLAKLRGILSPVRVGISTMTPQRAWNNNKHSTSCTSGRSGINWMFHDTELIMLMVKVNIPELKWASIELRELWIWLKEVNRCCLFINIVNFISKAAIDQISSQLPIDLLLLQELVFKMGRIYSWPFLNLSFMMIYRLKWIFIINLPTSLSDILQEYLRSGPSLLKCRWGLSLIINTMSAGILFGAWLMQCQTFPISKCKCKNATI